VDFPSWISGWTSPTYEPGEGMMYGLGSHTIDQALTLFGTPSKVTGFYRALRGVDSPIDDAFTIILQYGGEQKNLLVTVKTSVVTLMKDPLKYFVRGYDGTFVKYGTDPQEEQCIVNGMKATEEGFGVESEEIWGELTTKEKVDECQTKDKRTGYWIGRVKSEKGEHTRYYRDLVEAIRGGKGFQVKPEQSRDGIRVIELARESADTGCALKF
jgi:predicted dehydrogenase